MIGELSGIETFRVDMVCTLETRVLWVNAFTGQERLKRPVLVERAGDRLGRCHLQ